MTDQARQVPTFRRRTVNAVLIYSYRLCECKRNLEMRRGLGKGQRLSPARFTYGTGGCEVEADFLQADDGELIRRFSVGHEGEE